ncbi:processed acidic surface protein [Pontibacillus salipaludis]|uniref:Processed acidic surface protein n=1 Tax=Pontibacillus salipaludis TaxID=1697394 RepID=A0ABQ1QEA3_9BACI|nr:processed acidic surface protein [Pontibacillus salipaludis]GGD23183.1 hypothetical protein GCM10011389_33640 [Pontibacillus salipaludis]
MRGLLLVVLVGFLVALFPAVSSAAPHSVEVDSLVEELGWTVQDLEEYLDFYDLSLDEFEDIDELTEFLGEPLTDENLNALLDDYGLSLEEASQLLMENGELEEGQRILDVYTFLDDLDMDLSFYNLSPLTDEALKQLLEEYELTYEELLELLEQNDDSIENYEYIDDLELAIWNYLYTNEDMDYEDIEALFAELGLTEEELERLFNHFIQLDFEDSAKVDRLDQIATRMMAFSEFEVATQLSEEQVAELLDIFTQLMQLLELDPSFYLVKDGEKEAVSISSILRMASSDGYDLMVVLNTAKGEFLADIVLTADMFSSELIRDTGKDLAQVGELKNQSESKPPEPVKPQSPKSGTEGDPVVFQTERGGKLPDTASFAVEKTAIGLAVMGLGLFIYRRFKYERE